MDAKRKAPLPSLFLAAAVLVPVEAWLGGARTDDGPAADPSPVEPPPAASAKPRREPPPTATKVKPFGLELQLLGHMARAGMGAREDLEKRAAYLKSLGGEGYTVAAAHPGRKPEKEHLETLQRAYAALVSMPVRDAARRIEDFRRKEGIQVEPDPRSRRDKGPRGAVETYLGGIEAQVKDRRLKLESIELERRRPGWDPDRTLGLDAQAAQIEKQIRALEELKTSLGGLIPAIARYDALSARIQTLSRSEERGACIEEVARKAARFHEADPDVVAARGVGTHQVRLIVDAARRKAIEEALALRVAEGETVSGGRLSFIKGDLGFLPMFWKETAEERPRGDFRITEYVSGDEVFLTLFDCAGSSYRIAALEQKGKLRVLVPPAPLDAPEKKGRGAKPEKAEDGAKE